MVDPRVGNARRIPNRGKRVVRPFQVLRNGLRCHNNAVCFTIEQEMLGVKDVSS